MNERQALILSSLKGRNKDNVINYVKEVKESFSIDELITILNITRNRYNYLKRHNSIDWYIAKLGGFVS